MGAVIGALGAVVGVLATKFLAAGDAAESAAEKFDQFADAARRVSRDSKAALDAFTAELDASAPIFTGGKLLGPTIDQLEGQLDAIKRAEELLQEANRRRQLGADDIRPSARDTFGGIGESERNRLRKEREDQAKADEKAARDAARAQEERVRAAKKAADDLIRLERERFDYNAENIRQEVADFEKAQEDKIKAQARVAEEAARLQERYNQNLKRIQDDILGEQKRAQEAEAQRQADILAQPYKDLASDISDIISDGIQQGLEGDLDLQSLADTFGDAMSTTISGSIAAALTETLTKAAVSFGDFLSAQISQQTGAAGATGGAPGGGGSLTGGGAVVGGAAGGYVVGSIYGQVAGKEDTYAATGGSIGGGIGAGIGFAVTGGNPIGALVGGAVGSAAGSFIGGLFGGEGLGNDRSTQAYRSGQGITYSDASFSPENRNVTAGILAEIEALDEAFNGLGGVVADFKLRIEAGNKTGITVNGKKYDNAQDALRASIEELIGNTTGLSATQQTILANTKGQTAQEIGADLAFGEQYDALTFQGNEFERALQDLNKAFQANSRKAAELGLSVEALASAFAISSAEIARQADQQARSVQAQVALLGRGTGADTLDIQLYQLETDMRELAAAAAAVGIPIEQVTLAHQVQAQILVDLNNQQKAAAEEQRRAAAQAEAEQRRAQAEAEAARRRQNVIDRRSLVFQLGGYGNDNTPQRQIEALSIEFQSLYDRAGELGVPLRSVTQAFRRAVDEILEADAQLQRQRGLERRSLVLELGGYADTPAGQIEALSISFQTLYDQAGELGVPLRDVTKAFERAVADIIKADQDLQRQKGLDRRGLVLELAGFGAANDNSPQRQIEALSLSFQSLYDRAGQLGVPLSEVDKAFRRAVDEIIEADKDLRERFNRDVGLLEATELEKELAGIRDRFAELIETAQGYGRATDDLVAIQKRAEEQAIEATRDRLRDTDQSLINAQRDAFGQIDQYLDPLKQATGAFGIGQGVYSAQATAQSGIEEFRRQLELARGGDVGALSSLIGTGQSAIGAARAFGGSSDYFASVFKEVNRGLEEQKGVLEEKRQQLIQQGLDYQRLTLEEQIRNRVEVVNELKDLRAELSRALFYISDSLAA